MIYIFNFVNELLLNWYILIPNDKLSINENILIIFKIGLLILILVNMLNFDYYYNIIPFIIIISTLILYLIPNKEEKINQCIKSSIDNPYINILSTDSNIENKPCNNNKEKIKNYKFNLKQNDYDIFDNKHLERQFYTMPNTQIPNLINKVADWFYKIPYNCKYDGINCLKYKDERYH